MQGLLKEKGHRLTEDENEADIIVFNTCTVKGPTESFFKKKLKELESKGKKVILTGCIPQSEKKKEKLEKYSMVGTFQLEKIEEAVQETDNGNTVQFLKRENKSRLNIPKIRKNPLIEIVPINDGCLSACTFCKTKQARGNLYSYPENDIVRHISKAVEDGAKEIWLTSQDTAVYGIDQKSTIVELLKSIVEIKRSFRLRVGMGNPDFLKNYIDEYIKILKHEKVFRFVHIPVQAGSDKVLKDMRRKYTAEEYVQIVKKLKEEIPDITIATDIICGFPQENEEDFQKTIDIMKTTRPDVVNISRFWPRP
jgi:threonylcarbamoyladenosine tRNA methylthiotransferase CDKAL1